MQIYQRKTRLLTNAYDYCDSAIRWRNNLATYSYDTSSHHRGDDPKNYQKKQSYRIANDFG